MRKITKTVDGSCKIMNLLKDPDNYGKKNVDAQCLIVRDNRAIICIMSHLNFTVRQGMFEVF